MKFTLMEILMVLVVDLVVFKKKLFIVSIPGI